MKQLARIPNVGKSEISSVPFSALGLQPVTNCFDRLKLVLDNCITQA